MAYIPPSCGSVNFTLRPINIPLCHLVNFDLTDGGTAPVGIVIFDSVLNITHSTFYYRSEFSRDAVSGHC